MNAKESIKGILRAIFGRNIDALGSNALEHAAVVSFDVFDTLVVRDCPEPGVVFDLVERRYNESHPNSPGLSSFRSDREKAEVNARRLCGPGDPTVYEVYAMLPAMYSPIAHELLALELRTELSICRADPSAKDLYDSLICSGKCVVIASDMYLPAEWVATILETCGYVGHELLYVSSDLGSTKRSGAMFDAICSDFNISPADLLHIGDHPLSDFAVPRRYGSHAFLYRHDTIFMQHQVSKEREEEPFYGSVSAGFDAVANEARGSAAILPAISVIMPVYNSEEYLATAIESILSQDFECLELLLIDDGSTDGSGRICDEAALRDSRVKIFHVENGGICKARNCGLDNARGKYVAFSDDDDEYLPHCLSDNYALLEECGADLVRYGHVQKKVVDGVIRHTAIKRPERLEIISGREIARRYEYVFQNTQMQVWNAMYRRSLLEEAHIRFDEQLRGGYEDSVFNLAVYTQEPTMALNPNVYYSWMRRTEHSTSMRLDEHQISSLRLNMLAETEYLMRNDVDLLNPRLFQRSLYSPMTSAIAIAAQRPDVPFSDYTDFLDEVRGIYSEVDWKRVQARDPLLAVLGLLFEARRYRAIRLASTFAYKAKYLFR